MKEGGLDSRYYAADTHKSHAGSRHPSSQKFHDFCDAMKAMHDKKQQDYGRADDPFANVRSTEEWGQPAWVGAMIRATDKMRRLQKVAAGGTLANEGVEDSFMDLAVYAIIGLVLYLELQTPVYEAKRVGDAMKGLRQDMRGEFVQHTSGKVHWVPENAEKHYEDTK